MNEQTIWDYLYSKIKNPYAVAALMGNLYVESKLKPNDLQGSYERRFKLTDEEYTKAVDDGVYQSFVRDGAGYGLAQWTYWSRKEALYDFAKERGVSIGDLNMQLEYLWSEIQKYKPVMEAMKNATAIRPVSDVICEKYERPANQSEKGKQTRADYGQKFFDQFYSKTPEKSDQTGGSKHVVVQINRVNIRAGNGMNYPIICQANKNTTYKWVATSNNGWHAIVMPNRVAWVSGEFSKVE